MTQLIASNQLTLTNVIDGKTPYIHFAYADNADGTGLTLTDNGQRYIGNYSDYTQDDSTDKTKYTWADRWAKIEVGGRNLLKDQSKDWINVVRPAGDYYFQKGSDYKVEVGQTYTFSIVVEKVTNDAVPINLSIGLGRFIGTYTWDFPTGQIKGIQMGKRISITFTVSPTDGLSGKYPYFAWRLRNERLATTIRYKEVKLEKGTVATDWSPAPEDIEKGLDSKADQALTQQQLNMLIEKSQQMQTELEARAAMETLSDLERAYKAYVEANDKAVAKSQADLIEAGRRVEAMVETLGGLSKTKTFIDTYIKEAEEGIIIGTNDNVSQIRIIYDRIAMYSAGKEVMYISQGVIHIDNGVFTKTLQIGRFRTEQHQTNLDINVCRYVG